MSTRLAAFLFDTLDVFLDFRAFSFDQRHDLAESPLEVAVAHLLSR